MARTELRVASFGRRVAASLIDGLLLAIPWWVILAASGEPARGWYTLLPGAVYTVGAIALWGQTVGKWLLGLKVIVDDRPGVELPGWTAAAIRYAVLGVPWLAPGLYGPALGITVTAYACYGMLTDDLARGVQDTLAGTRVIDVR